MLPMSQCCTIFCEEKYQKLAEEGQKEQIYEKNADNSMKENISNEIYEIIKSQMQEETNFCRPSAFVKTD